MYTDPKPSNNKETLESIKDRFSKKLTNVLYEKLTVDNIETFADDALDQAVSLTNEIMEYYYNSDDVNPDLEFKDQEDDAYEKLGLPKISNILDRIEEKKNEIDRIKDKIKKEYTDTVITPPQENKDGIIPGEGKSFEKKKLLPRLLTLMYILENDLEIDLENVKITEGQVRSNMMRQTPYVRIEIDDLERLVYICDEEGNASYIFDTEKLKERRITLNELDIDDKGDKNSLIYHYPGIGVRVIQTKNWRDRIKNLLENEIPVVGEEKNPLGEIGGFEGEKVESEFKKREKKVILPYEEFIIELRDAYQLETKKITEFQKWYREEAKKHKGWYRGLPSVKNMYKKEMSEIYKYIGYTRSKRERRDDYIDYEEWVDEVKQIFNEKKDTIFNFSAWYLQEAKKHLNWYANVEHATKIYKRTLKQVYESMGYEKNLEKNESYLPYDKWVIELKDAIKKAGGKIRNINAWYREEVKKHNNWYSEIQNGIRYYKKSVKDFYVDIDYKRNIVRHESYVNYDEWQQELINIFNENKDSITNISGWYRKEAKRHEGWYSTIEEALKKYGVDRPKFYNSIGYERNINIQEKYLSYSEWINELRKVYYEKIDNITSFSRWYKEESKRHKGWYTTFAQAHKSYDKSYDDIYDAINYQGERKTTIAPQTLPGPTH